MESATPWRKANPYPPRDAERFGPEARLELGALVEIAAAFLAIGLDRLDPGMDVVLSCRSRIVQCHVRALGRSVQFRAQRLKLHGLGDQYRRRISQSTRHRTGRNSIGDHLSAFDRLHARATPRPGPLSSPSEAPKEKPGESSD